MKHLILVAFIAAAGMAWAYKMNVDQVIPRYPWNGFVDIDYTVEYGDGEAPLTISNHVLSVTVTDSSSTPATSFEAHLFETGPLPLAEGLHRITWDAHADGVTSVFHNVSVKLAVKYYPPVYMLVDLRGGPTAASFPITYLDGEPEGGFNQEKYKGDYMVFRRIHPSLFEMGAVTNDPKKTTAAYETRRSVKLTKPYYIGVFEVTQKQFLNVMPDGTANPSACVGDYYPLNHYNWNSFRGNVGNKASERWPDNKSVPSGTFVHYFRQKTSLDFDLPTEAQWECACRAGTETSLYTGVTPQYDSVLLAEANKMGRHKSNRGSETFAVVGSFMPNGFGLYDMCGNAREYVLDAQADSYAYLKRRIDPEGPTMAESTSTGYYRIVKGGSYEDGCESFRSNWHSAYAPGTTYSQIGYRLVLTLD